MAFWLQWNENEKWLNAHKIFSFSRKIDERIRLDQYVFPEYILLLAEKCVTWIDDSGFKYEIFKELQELDFIWKKISLNHHVRANIDSYLISGLTEYFIKKSKIIPIRRNWWKQGRMAFSNTRQIEIHDFLIPLPF